MKIKALICSSKGVDALPSSDIDPHQFAVEAADRQFMVDMGPKSLEDLLGCAEDEPDTYVVASGCCEMNAGKQAAQNRTIRSTASSRNPEVATVTSESILVRVAQRVSQDVVRLRAFN